MTDVVDHKKNSDDRQWSRPDAEREKRDQRAQRQPARPDEAITHATERSAKSCPETLDHRRGNIIELSTRESANRNSGEVRMRVEITRLPSDRLRVPAASSPPGELP